MKKYSATLFIDESGKSSLAEKENEPFLLTGVVLDNTELVAVEGFFKYIRLKFKIPLNIPFHSYETFEKSSTKLSDNDINLLTATLAEFISLIPISIYLVAINKEEFKNALGIISNEDFKGSKERKEMKEFPYRVMASYIFAHFARYLEDCDAMGQITADSRRGGDYQLLKTLNLCKEGVIPFKENYSQLIKTNVTAMCFAEKSFMSGGLEITDLISFVSFMRYRRLLSKNLDGFTKIWNEIKLKSKITKISDEGVKKFFSIKKGEVHKYLKST